MSLFELPADITDDMKKVLAALQLCCQKVDGFGKWHDVPFNAANFRPFDLGATWTVGPGNVKTLKYEIVQDTMTVAFDVIHGSATGKIFGLLIELPLPYHCVYRAAAGTRLFSNACTIVHDLSLNSPGIVSLQNDLAGRLILFCEQTNGNQINTQPEAGTFGQITFEIRP